MNKKKELARNTIILTVGKICTQFVSFMLLPLYTALLLPEEYGIVDLLNTYITLLVPLFNWQFENGLFRFMIDVRDDKDELKKIFSTVLTTNFVQILIYIIFYMVAQNFITSEFKIFLAIDVGLNIILNTLLQFPRGIGNNTAYALASFISATTAVVMNVVFIAGFRMGALGMFLATVIAKIVTILYLAISQKIWKYYSLNAFSKSKFKSIAHYSFPLIPNQLSWWVVGASDRTIVSYFVGVFANGIYSVANKFAGVFITFYNIFNMSWTESVALHMKDEDGADFIKETVNCMFNLFSAIDFGIIAVMPFVFPIMVNEQYGKAYFQIPILMLAILFQVVVGLYSTIYVALKKSVEIAKTSAYAAAINIIVDLALIKFIGIYAASLSTLIAYAVMAIYRYFDVKKYMNVSLERKNLISVVIIGILTITSYYFNKFILNCITFIIVAIYAFVLNKNFIVSVIRTIYDRIGNKRK